MATGKKAPDAFRTIGELSADLGVAQHILRYWETKFPQLRPLQRAGNRRYYRPADVALAKRIHSLLNEEGYTVKGVQKLLRSKNVAGEEPLPSPPPTRNSPETRLGLDMTGAVAASTININRLKFVRDHLVAALKD